jgi:hypothetical protein
MYIQPAEKKVADITRKGADSTNKEVTAPHPMTRKSIDSSERYNQSNSHQV